MRADLGVVAGSEIGIHYDSMLGKLIAHAPTRREAAQVLRRALDETWAADLLGGVTIVVHRGAGAYICGEETALLDSLEGRRGQPRPRPPFPPVQGLYNAPTQINNVCTIASVPGIIAMGAAEWAKIGAESSPAVDR